MAKNENQAAEVVRIMGTGVRGTSTLVYGLSQIKGVNVMFANATCYVLGLDKNKKISSLSEKEIQTIEEFLSNPVKEKIPSWMLNSRNDPETGENSHVVGRDMEYSALQFRRRLAKTKSYRALRHRARLPLRGQRTKSNFRRTKTLRSMKSKSQGRKK